MFAGEGEWTSDDDLPGRRFTFWPPEALVALLEGAGFVGVKVEVVPAPDGTPKVHISGTRARTLPDTVAPGMRLLVCGLNPSLHSADAAVPYAGPANRFWPALAAAELLPPGAEKDPWRLLADGRIGITDLVKRATPRAAELTTDEYCQGLARLERLCALVAPAAVVAVGLSGWRAAVDRRAAPGWQARRIGPAPVYVMPSTSGLNCAVPLADLAGHLRGYSADSGGQVIRALTAATSTPRTALRSVGW
jgi:TDG/mug DNA glycosylase family protein